MDDIFDLQPWPKDAIYIESSLTLETPLCRYTRLENLLSLLNGNFFVSKRGSFCDMSEYKGDITEADFKFRLLIGNQYSATDIKNVKDFLNVDAKNLFVSCWSSDTNESYLMWKAYTPDKYGVMIKASIHNIASSFGSPLPHIICSEMRYGKLLETMSILDALFHKDTSYKDEKEVRFYIQSLDSTLNINNTFFKISPTIMVDEIILSPFLSDTECLYIKDLLGNRFPEFKNKINSSVIKIKYNI